MLCASRRGLLSAAPSRAAAQICMQQRPYSATQCLLTSISKNRRLAEAPPPPQKKPERWRDRFNREGDPTPKPRHRMSRHLKRMHKRQRFKEVRSNRIHSASILTLFHTLAPQKQDRVTRKQKIAAALARQAKKDRVAEELRELQEKYPLPPLVEYVPKKKAKATE